MSINLVCKVCKSNLSVRSRVCKNCGYDFRNGKKYKVVVKGKDGRRISKVLDSISTAKKLERKLKTQSLENSLFGISKIRMFDYLSSGIQPVQVAQLKVPVKTEASVLKVIALLPHTLLNPTSPIKFFLISS